MILALTILLVASLWAFTLYLLNEARISAEKRERDLRLELYSVLGRDETVSISLSNDRPAGQIRYVDDSRAIQLQKNGGVTNEP